MNTQIIYVLTSCEKDYFLEQLWISLYSLRLHNEDAHVVLLIDNKTNATLLGYRRKILDFIDELKIIETPSEYNMVDTSRYLKTQVRNYIDGDYLYIDCDTIITDDLSGIDEFSSNGIELGMVKDRHVNLGELKFIDDNVRKLLTKTGHPELFKEGMPFFNCGIMFVKDTQTTRLLFHTWYERWKDGLKEGIHIDQIAYLQAVDQVKIPIIEIDGIWNCQICTNALPFLVDARIIHYFNSNIHEETIPFYYFFDKKIFHRIKVDGDIPEDIVCNIKNAKKAFYKYNMISVDSDINFLKSCIHICYERHHRIYQILKFLATIRVWLEIKFHI